MSVSTSTAVMFDDGSQQRALWLCVGASMIFHVAVLTGFSGLREAKPAQAPARMLTAKLARSNAAPVAEAVRPPEPPPPPPQVKPQPVQPVPVQSKASPTAPKVEAAPVAPVAPVAPAAPSAPTPPQPAAVAVPAPPVQQAAAAPSAATTTEQTARASDADEAGSRDQYRLALIGAAKRYKRYPAQAMQNGWTGKAEIRLVIGTNGMIQSAAIKTSTGFSLLDDTALDMIKKAKPLTQIPPALRGKEFTVDVPVIFDLATG